MIPLKEVHGITDCTKLGCYMECPRAYFYKHILGWREDMPNHNLWYGQAFHYMMEYIYNKWRKEPGYHERTLVESFAVFLSHYRKKFGENTDSMYGGKNPDNTMQAILDYAEHYRDDDFQVLYAEISGTVPVGRKGTTDLLLYFKLDTVTEDDSGVEILEHKTSGWFEDAWKKSHTLDIQAGMGNHVLYSLYGERSKGVNFNGIFLKKVPRKDEYQNSFVRHRVFRNPALMQVWLETVQHFMSQLHDDIDKLASCKEGDEILGAFPQNPKSCFKYNHWCEFFDFCEYWPNPLQNGIEPPIGFVTELWDPRSAAVNQEGKVQL